jgi:type VI secretion system ImpC/EvpB family protein/type VI secretion system ImpB/VipA family protein
MLLVMAGGETKGWMGGSMKFGVSDELGPDEKERGPLLPLRLLVVTELVARAPYNAGASAPEGTLRVDTSRFDDLFGKLRPRAAVEVPSVLHEGRPTRVDFSPTSMKSFRPDGLLAEVPLLRSLFDGRMVLERLRDGALQPEQAQIELDRLWNGSPFVRKVLGLLPVKTSASAPVAASASTAAQPATNVDSLLDMIDLGGTAAASASAPELYEAPQPAPVAEMPNKKLSDLIASVARSGRSGSGVRPTEAVNRVDKAIGAQIGAILQHPEVRRLEKAWRGLRFLAERTQNHTGVRIDVVSARADETAAAMQRAIRENASSEPPVSCAIVDIAIDGTALGFARLEAIADVAEHHTVPAIVNGVAKLLGVDDLRGIEKLDNKAALFQTPQQAPWRSASAKPALRWVAIAMNGMLARAPYDKTTSRVREATVKELPDDEGAFVWIDAAYAVATLVVTSFRETGWPCRILGARSGGLIGDLPVRELKGDFEGEEGIAIPTEVFISTDTQRELSRSGVLMLASAPNSDAVYVHSAPTAYVTPPKRTYDSASTEPEVRLDRVSLGDQLFVARLVQFLRALCSKLPSSSDPAEVQPVMEGALAALFENAAPASVELSVRVEGRPDGTIVALDVKPRRFLGVQLEEMSLEMPLG